MLKEKKDNKSFGCLILLLIVIGGIICLKFVNFGNSLAYSIVNFIISFSVLIYLWKMPLEDITNELLNADDNDFKGGKIFKHVYLVIFCVLSTIAPYLSFDGYENGIFLGALAVFILWHIVKFVQILFAWIRDNLNPTNKVDIIKTIKKDRKTQRLLLYALILGTYLLISITTVHNWENSSIQMSPTVYMTKTGHKYHRSYHYSGRNYPISLFEALEDNYTSCRVCKPYYLTSFPERPDFYIYNWFWMSFGITVVYWSIILIIRNKNKKTLHNKM